ncbi:MAG: hypothetical protein JO127_01575 [Caulobacteraceae bacterium]|nr:hypothetical protein [Caulobacteraceae bacterium]
MNKITLTASIISAALLAGSQSLAQPSTDPHAGPNAAVKSPSDTASGPLAKGHNSFSRAEAKSRLEKAGYVDVTGLSLDQDGLWRAQAKQNGQPVSVALDYKGDIAVQ